MRRIRRPDSWLRNLTSRPLSSILACCVLGISFVSSAVPAAEVKPRIISLYAAHTEVLLRLGARDHIVGVSRQETYDGPEAADWNPPAFSIRDDIEMILAAKPDIVLVRPQHVAGARHAVSALERFGVRVVALQVTTPDELYAYWRALAALVEREKEAERLVDSFDQAIRRYQEALRTSDSRPGVFVESIHKEVKTFTPDSLPMWLVGLAGGRNVAADAEPATQGVIIADYGPERLLAKASEVEIFISQTGPMNRTTMDNLTGRSIYRHLPAFQNGTVYTIPEAILARPTPSLLHGLEMIAGWTGLAVD